MDGVMVLTFLSYLLCLLIRFVDKINSLKLTQNYSIILNKAAPEYEKDQGAYSIEFLKKVDSFLKGTQKGSRRRILWRNWTALQSIPRYASDSQQSGV